MAINKDYAQVSRESRYITTVPSLAIQNLMEKHDLVITEFDLIEIAEVFWAIPLVSCKVLGMDEKVNVNGSVVATVAFHHYLVYVKKDP